MKRTTGRRYVCNNPDCNKFGSVWVTPIKKMTDNCVCGEAPAFLGYVEEDV